MAKGQGSEGPSRGESRRRYISVVAVEILVGASIFLVYKIAEARWGGEGFGEYLLARKAISLLYLPLLIGLGLSVSRYVAMASVAGQGRDRTSQVLLAGILLAVSVALPVLTGVWLLRRFAAGLVFGGPGYERYVGAVIVAVTGLILHSIAYAYACGRLRIRIANVLKGFNMGLVPLIAVVWPGATASSALAWSGAAWLIVASAILMTGLAAPAGGSLLPGLGGTIAELFRYGSPRVPGDLALVGLFAFPTMFVAHVSGVEAAGQFGFAIALLGAVGILLAPTGVVLLPTAARLIHLGKWSETRTHVKKLLVIGIGVALLGTAALQVLAAPILSIMFGEAGSDALPVARVVLLGTLPYAVYLLLRNLLDAMEFKAINAKNLIWALAGMLLFGALFQSAIGVAWGLAFGLVVLGLLTALEVRARL